MSEPTEQDEAPDDAAGAPVTPETVLDDDEATEEAEAAEADAGEPPEARQRDEQKAMDKMFKDFEKEAKRHTERVAVIAGDSAPDLLQCPMCAPDEGQPTIPGWLLPVPPSEEKIANVRQAIGLAPKIEYREDPHSRVCPTCGGLRSVVPAGDAAAALTLPCHDCKAQGWIATDEARGGPQQNGSNAQNVTLETLPAPQLEPDSPEIAALKAAGYTVIAPYTAAT